MGTFRILLGSRIKLLRKTKGLNQTELAEAMGVEINTISRYETGANTPSVEQLLNLAQALGVSPMKILPPQDPVLQRVLALRQDINEKIMHIDSPEDLEELVLLANAFMSASCASKK